MITDQDARQKALEFILGYEQHFLEKRADYERAASKYSETRDEYWNNQKNLLLAETYHLPRVLETMHRLLDQLNQHQGKDSRPRFPRNVVEDALLSVANYADDFSELRRRKKQIEDEMIQINDQEKYLQLSQEGDQVNFQLEVLEKKFVSAKSILVYEK